MFCSKTESDFWTNNWTRAGTPVWSRKQRFYSGLFMLFSGGFLVFSFFLVTPYIYSGLYAFSFGAILATKGVKFLRSKRNLPSILRRLASDGSIRNYVKAIDAFVSVNDFKKAILYAEESICKHPKSALLLAWTADTYTAADKDDLAIPYARKAMEIDPKSEFVKGSVRRLRHIGYKIEKEKKQKENEK